MYEKRREKKRKQQKGEEHGAGSEFLR